MRTLLIKIEFIGFQMLTIQIVINVVEILLFILHFQETFKCSYAMKKKNDLTFISKFLAYLTMENSDQIFVFESLTYFPSIFK